MDTKHYKILKYLAPFGVGVYSDISHILNELFPVQDISQKQSIVENELRLVIGLIQGMVKDGLISAENYSLGSWMGNEEISWLHNTKIMASISIKGLEQIENELSKSETQKINESNLELNESNKLTNQAVRDNIRTQEKIQWINLFFAAVSTAFIVLTGVIAYKDKQEERLSEIASNIEKLTDEIAKQKSFQTIAIDTNLLNKNTDTKPKKH